MKKLRNSSFDEDGHSLINITPLIDVIFVVLIMFMLIAPLLNVEHIKLASASKSAKEISTLKSHNLQIHIYENNTLTLNGKKITLQNLSHELHLLPKQTVPQVLCDKKAHFGAYQQVKIMLENAGFKQMDLILDAK